SVRALIARVRATNLAAYGHQELPFERLVEAINPARSLARHPLFQVMLVLQNTDPPSFAGLPQLSAPFEDAAIANTKFALSLNLVEQRGPDGAAAGIDAALDYATDLFDRGSIEALAERLVRLLAAAMAEPERPISNLDILAPEERRSILRDWNATAYAL